jgi:hypothetical protein
MLSGVLSRAWMLAHGAVGLHHLGLRVQRLVLEEASVLVVVVCSVRVELTGHEMKSG